MSSKSGYSAELRFQSSENLRWRRLDNREVPIVELGNDGGQGEVVGVDEKLSDEKPASKVLVQPLRGCAYSQAVDF